MSTKIQDIKVPKNTWERMYTRLEYERHGLLQVGARKIEVTTDTIFVCNECGALNDYWEHLCAPCDLKADAEIDEIIQNG